MPIFTRTLTLTLASLFVLAACGDDAPNAEKEGTSTTPLKPYFQALPPPVHISHRGGADLYPENTLFAFERTLEEWDSDVIEIDLYRSLDGHIVIIHDKTVDRTTDGTGLVVEKTLSELKALDAAYRFDPKGDESYPQRGKGHTIPTLEEVFNALPEAYFNIEIKDPDAKYEDQVHDLIMAHGLREKVCWGSSNDASAQRLRAIDPDIAIYYPMEAVLCFALAVSRGNDPMTQCPHHYDALNLPEGTSTAENIAAAHANGIGVYTWTINDTARMEALFALGVDGIITDRPDLLRQVIDGL